MKALAWRAGLVSAAGVTLLAVIGAAGRMPSTYQSPSIPERDEANLRAYAKPVLAAMNIDDRSTDAEVRSALDLWLAEYNKGKLFSVAPAHLDDLADKGARGEILRARKRLSGQVQARAMVTEKKDKVAAAKYYGDLITLNDIFKFSGPETMTSSTYFQHLALRSLDRLAPALSEDQKRAAKEKIDGMLRPSEPLGPFTLRINAAYRRSTEETPDQGNIVSNALRELSTTTPEIVEAKGSKFSVLATQESMLKSISTSMYMALRAEQRVREEASELSAVFAAK